MPRLSWSDGALRGILRHHDFLASSNRGAARRVVKAIRAGVKAIVDYPEIGRPAEGVPDDVREWVINFGGSAYVALYRFADGTVFILAVRHGREDGY